ncbi:cell division protein SepF [Amycolatopsis sp. CA-230715]|uniref:cell division protein SepF n=1 Tax=Amycolatopsis sp. CA-230715 TaxID=2745196 RepID=UPI001C036E11|nr:cell division protein SepF [Amycolatopsis sp. CA-230715]QWF84771.1 Cell division protein SepF [Amycolatopsis sp. CA-230715]
MDTRRTGHGLGSTCAAPSYDEDAYGEDFADDHGVEAPERHIAVVRLNGFHEVRIIGEYFRRDIPVLFDVQDLDPADAKRVIDFASGAILGRRGDIQRVSNRVFLMLPPNTSVLTPQS